MDTDLDKASIRARSIQKRKAMPEEEYRSKSELISLRLFSFCVERQIKVIHCFLPMVARREPDISRFIDMALDGGIRVIVPEVVKGQLEMRHHWYKKSTRLQDGHWGVSVPSASDEADPSFAELIMVPMLAAGRKGYRVGYGKGFYDYFLSRIDAVFVGVCFSNELVDHVPNEPHDVQVHYFATDEGIIMPQSD